MLQRVTGNAAAAAADDDDFGYKQIHSLIAN
jgi:hypothetical protein